MQAGVDAFIVFENKVLLILRDNISGIQNPNMWNLPGGGIEADETEREALIRELKEEVNLTPKEVHYLDKTTYPDGNIVTKFWVTITAQEKAQLKLGEGQEMKFFDLTTTLSLNIIPNLKSYLTSHKEKIENLIEEN